MIRRAVAIACLFVLAWAPIAQAARVAFVTGTNRYDNLPEKEQLRRAVNDATAMKQAFEELGFKVHFGTDLTQSAFYDKWQGFLKDVQVGDVVAVFAAGHGVEMSGSNYLLPRDVSRPSDGEARFKSRSVSVSDLVSELDRLKARETLLFLDACRGNPWAAVEGARHIRSLAPIELQRRGVLVLYSAGFGQSSLDFVPEKPEIAISVFTYALARNLIEPNLDMMEVATRVMKDVDGFVGKAGHQQMPVLYTQLIDKVYLAGSPAPAKVPVPLVEPPPTLKLSIDEMVQILPLAGFVDVRRLRNGSLDALHRGMPVMVTINDRGELSLLYEREMEGVSPEHILRWNREDGREFVRVGVYADLSSGDRGRNPMLLANPLPEFVRSREKVVEFLGSFANATLKFREYLRLARAASPAPAFK